MPPKTNAERQKAYRERLKTKKPNKYEEMRVKHLSKVKENIRKKNEILTEEEKEELRAKWRQANAKRAERKKKTNPTTQNNNTLEVRKISKNNTKMLKERLQKLTEENTKLKRRNKNLRQACSRMKRRMEILKKTLLEQQTNNDAISDNSPPQVKLECHSQNGHNFNETFDMLSDPNSTVSEVIADGVEESDVESDEPVIQSIYPKWLIEVEKTRAEADLTRARADERRVTIAAKNAEAAFLQAEALKKMADAATSQADALTKIARLLENRMQSEKSPPI